MSRSMSAGVWTASTVSLDPTLRRSYRQTRKSSESRSRIPIALLCGKYPASLVPAVHVDDRDGAVARAREVEPVTPDVVEPFDVGAVEVGGRGDGRAARGRRGRAAPRNRTAGRRDEAGERGHQGQAAPSISFSSPDARSARPVADRRKRRTAGRENPRCQVGRFPMRAQGFGRNGSPRQSAWSTESSTSLKWSGAVPGDHGARARVHDPSGGLVEGEHPVLVGEGARDVGVVHELVGLLVVGTRCPSRGSRWSRPPVFSWMTWFVGHARGPQLLGRHVREVDPVQQRQLRVLGLARLARRCLLWQPEPGQASTGSGNWLGSVSSPDPLDDRSGHSRSSSMGRLPPAPVASRRLSTWSASQPRSGRRRRSTERRPRGPTLAR